MRLLTGDRKTMSRKQDNQDNYDIINNIVKGSTIILAVVFSIYSFFVSPVSLYEGMILTLLTLIATSFLLDQMGEDKKC